MIQAQLCPGIVACGVAAAGIMNELVQGKGCPDVKALARYHSEK